MLSRDSEALNTEIGKGRALGWKMLTFIMECWKDRWGIPQAGKEPPTRAQLQGAPREREVKAWSSERGPAWRRSPLQGGAFLLPLPPLPSCFE